MTVQQLCDRLTELCHEGCAQYEVLHTSGMEIKNVTRVEEVGKTILITSWKNPEEYKDETYGEVMVI